MSQKMRCLPLARSTGDTQQLSVSRLQRPQQWYMIRVAIRLLPYAGGFVIPFLLAYLLYALVVLWQ